MKKQVYYLLVGLFIFHFSNSICSGQSNGNWHVPIETDSLKSTKRVDTIPDNYHHHIIFDLNYFNPSSKHLEDLKTVGYDSELLMIGLSIYYTYEFDSINVLIGGNFSGNTLFSDEYKSESNRYLQTEYDFLGFNFVGQYRYELLKWLEIYPETIFGLGYYKSSVGERVERNSYRRGSRKRVYDYPSIEDDNSLVLNFGLGIGINVLFFKTPTMSFGLNLGVNYMMAGTTTMTVFKKSVVDEYEEIQYSSEPQYFLFKIGIIIRGR